MRWNLPPLNAVRAFEAAGRHKSFKNAAAELGVTTGAISRQIKILEQFLDTILFERGNREIRLTTEGHAYLTLVYDALRRIDSATTGLKEQRRERPLSIMCCASLATRWLFPRLPRFYARHPHARLTFSSLASPRDYLTESQNFDVVIRSGDGNWSPEVTSYRLFGSELVAVCSPKLLQSGPPLRNVADLERHTLLFSLFRPDAWQRWFAAIGEPQMDAPLVTKFESSGLTYQAATQGLGIALAERRFIVDDIAQARLVAPFEFIFLCEDGFYLVHKRQAAALPHLKEFRKWIVEEAETDATLEPVHRRKFRVAAQSMLAS